MNEKMRVAAVVYDGVTNSVFASMMLASLLKQLDDDQDLEVTIVSFEPKKITSTRLAQLIPAHDRLSVIQLKRLPFFGRISLWFEALKLRSILHAHSFNQLIVRGPLAGKVVLDALRLVKSDVKSTIKEITIQARGLCAEEYRYATKKNAKKFKHVWQAFRYRQLFAIEKSVYAATRKHWPFEFQIQSVSPALCEYLAKTFDADHSKITLSSNDLPNSIGSVFLTQWRDSLRKELNIMSDAYVYCYSGSYKPWQCADETIKYFAEHCMQEARNFLLILSQDKDKFITEVLRCKIPKNRFLVMSVHPDEVYKYLSVADAGFLLREPDVINWVSRPTKMLEYQAVGLKIIHNDTIALLAKPQEK